jgi:hypothetical protein
MMPCIQCSNGKWKYGAGGDCNLDSLAACKRVEAAVHAQNNPQVTGPHGAHPAVQNKLPKDPVNPPSAGDTTFYTNNPNGHMTMEEMYNQVNTPGTMGGSRYRM